MVPPAPLEHFSSLLGNFKAAFTGMDIQKILRSPYQCFVSETHTYIPTHAHTEPGFTALYVCPIQSSAVNGCSPGGTWGNPGTEETIPNMPVPCSHGNSILPADIP